MSSEFGRAVESIVATLIESPGVGGHIRFDDPEFKGIVPEFDDVAWIALAREAAAIANRFPGRILVDVPLGRWQGIPEPFRVDELRTP